ncbi:hypothetical protein BGZ50_003134 [Haplosporangium sp. Z 11]|nr:hypothetical protein BGZ50_003134 [Haplosporangium sp. Z 11]
MTNTTSRRIIDRVRQRVDNVLERKRTTRGFTSVIRPDESNMAEYAICLKDLEALTCAPELDLLPIPESLEYLMEQSRQHEAEVEVEAEAEAAASAMAAASVQESSKTNTIDQDIIMIECSTAKPAPPISANPKLQSLAQSNGNGNMTSKIQNGQSEGHSGIRSPQPMSTLGRSPSSPPPTKSKYSILNEVDADISLDPVPAVDYRPITTFSNGADRTIRKRARNDRIDGSGEKGVRPMQFITAKEQLAIEEQQQEEKRSNHYMNRGGFNAPTSNPYGISNNSSSYNTSTSFSGSNPKSKALGTKRAKFKSPINKSNSVENSEDASKVTQSRSPNGTDEPDERLRNIDPKMIEAIKNEIMESYPVVTWDDISGLEHAKKTIEETITWPMLRPDIFTGLRRPPKGLLLFGPPGTGKTMIGKCIASQSKATFFSISSSSLTSKWIGDGEKMVRALFAVARCHQPAVIFMDEIDSLLTQRSDGEVEASRRIKTEFLVQFDGVGVGGEEDQILIVGATNRPQEIDEAARRRFQKRLYVPLPEHQGRYGLMMKLLEKQSHGLTADQVQDICERTAGYSGSDMTGLCREAALGPVRAIRGNILEIGLDALRPISHKDFLEALSQVRASVSDKDLDLYRDWDAKYGSMAMG